jgi:hypothetical protein
MRYLALRLAISRRRKDGGEAGEDLPERLYVSGSRSAPSSGAPGAAFHEFAAVIDAAQDGPPDPEAIKSVMLRHGLAPAPPSA